MAKSRRDLAERIAELAGRTGDRIAVAESLTGGQLSSDLAKATDASEWFRGGVVSYATEVKREVLSMPPGPVVSRAAVVAMADNVARLLGASCSVAVSGVGGPGRQDGQPPGTVWIAVRHDGSTSAGEFHFAGEPDEICARTCAVALGLLHDRLAEPGRSDDLDA